jgi:catechol 2,3-dioxygenase-like lactoylglutathione lyase family enzyme
VKLEKPQLDIGLVTADASKARSFYGEILGYPEEEPQSFGGDAVQYRFRAGDQLLKLMDLPEKPETQPTGIYDRIGYRVLAVFVDDLPALRERIHESGRKSTEPTVIVGDLAISFAKDADGNMLELIGLPEPQGDALGNRLQIGLTVADVEKSRDFYGRVLGLAEQPQMEMGKGLTRYAFSAGSTTLKFWCPGDGLPRGSGPIDRAVGIRFVTFTVADLDGLCGDLESCGAPVIVAPTRLANGSRIMFVEDPDGNWIEFAEHTGSAP